MLILVVLVFWCRLRLFCFSQLQVRGATDTTRALGSGFGAEYVAVQALGPSVQSSGPGVAGLGFGGQDLGLGVQCKLFFLEVLYVDNVSFSVQTFSWIRPHVLHRIHVLLPVLQHQHVLTCLGGAESHLCTRCRASLRVSGMPCLPGANA